MNLQVETIRALLDKYGHGLDDTASEYGEPGYTKEHDNPILFANWNDVPRHIMDRIEAQYDIEWSDEWIMAYETGKAYRQSPDCYGWLPSYVILNECEVSGVDEIEKDADLLDTYLETIINNPKHCALVSNDCLEKAGFENLNGRFENGLHPGQNDNPKTILAEWQKKEPEMDFVFANMSAGQFDIHFEIWGKTH